MPPALPTLPVADPGSEADQAPESGPLAEQISLLGDDSLLVALPALGKTRKILTALRQGNLLLPLIKQLLLLEEVRRTGGQIEDLASWRISRWQSRVQQAFVQQRRRFERASYYQLSLPEKGIAMELYLQLCNREVSFEELLARFLPAKPGRKQLGILREKSLQKLPAPLAKKLRRSIPGQPIAPLSIGRVVTLFQLIQWHEPVLDDATRVLLEGEVEDQWLVDELHRRFDVDRQPPSEAAGKPAAPAPGRPLPPGSLVTA